MDSSDGSKRQKLTATEKSSSSNCTTEKSVTISADASPISRLPPELLSSIIDYIPKTQWSSLELVNRSFRDAVYSSWQSVKEFDIDKDVYGIRQSFKRAGYWLSLADFLPKILGKLLIRSPMLQSIVGLPPIFRSDNGHYQSEILNIICQFTHLKRIGGSFGADERESVVLVQFLTSSTSRHQLVEIVNSSIEYQPIGKKWPAIATENSASQASRVKLEKLCLKNEYLRRTRYEEPEVIFLDTRIIDLIDLPSLTTLVLDKIVAPSQYLFPLITNCSQLQQLQFTFLENCRCRKKKCVHSTNSKRLLEAIPGMESLDSVKIGLIENRISDPDTEEAVDRPCIDIVNDIPVLIDHLGQRGRLVEFGLLHEDYCSNQIIDGIANHLPGLKSLELFTWRCRPATLVNMIKKMVSLEKLTFRPSDDEDERKAEDTKSWNRAITSDVLKAAATHLKNLKSFHMWRPFEIHCLYVLTQMEHLEELTINCAHPCEIKWESSFGHQLQYLDLQNCCEEFVASFLKQVPGLRRLFITGSEHLSNDVLRMVPVVCPRLREFCLCPAYWKTNEGVQAIIDGCTELERLQIIC